MAFIVDADGVVVTVAVVVVVVILIVVVIGLALLLMLLPFLLSLQSSLLPLLPLLLSLFSLLFSLLSLSSLELGGQWVHARWGGVQFSQVKQYENFANALRDYAQIWAGTSIGLEMVWVLERLDQRR